MIASLIVGVHLLEQVDPVVGLHVLDELQHGPGPARFQAGLLGFQRQLLEGLDGDRVADLHQGLDDLQRAQAAVFKILGDVGRMALA
ncbi:MAG: hypothetical protein MZU91_14865 [Desulfosudis oleivorans]|nr:hypothetical protein [Desulfosudis oleivorans]